MYVDNLLVNEALSYKYMSYKCTCASSSRRCVRSKYTSVC